MLDRRLGGGGVDRAAPGEEHQGCPGDPGHEKQKTCHGEENRQDNLKKQVLIQVFCALWKSVFNRSSAVLVGRIKNSGVRWLRFRLK